MPRFDRSAFFAFLASRFSFNVLPCFLLCPDGGALLPMAEPYAPAHSSEVAALRRTHRHVCAQRHTGPVPSDAKFVDAWPAVKKELERDLAPLRQRVAASTRCVERFRLRLDMRKMRRRAWRKARGSFIRW